MLKVRTQLITWGVASSTQVCTTIHKKKSNIKIMKRETMKKKKENYKGKQINKISLFEKDGLP